MGAERMPPDCPDTLPAFITSPGSKGAIICGGWRAESCSSGVSAYIHPPSSTSLSKPSPVPRVEVVDHSLISVCLGVYAAGRSGRTLALRQRQWRDLSICLHLAYRYPIESCAHSHLGRRRKIRTRNRRVFPGALKIRYWMLLCTIERGVWHRPSCAWCSLWRRWHFLQQASRCRPARTGDSNTRFWLTRCAVCSCFSAENMGNVMRW